MAVTPSRVIDGSPGSSVSLYEYDSAALLSTSLASFIQKIAEDSVSKHGSFSVVLSGGSLVKALSALSQDPVLSSIDWSRCHVFWADERCVPLDSPDSNYLGAHAEFLSKVPIPPTNVHTIAEGAPVSQAASFYASNLKDLVAKGVLQTSEGYPVFDLILLGMGPDGHVASLFPGHPLLKETTLWVAPISDSPKPPPERITLTLPVLNAAAHVAFVAMGEGKADMVARVLKQGGGGEGPNSILPVQMVRPVSGQLAWFCDKAATKLV